MVKLTLEHDWHSADTAAATLDAWLAQENAKIPADIRESLRGFFPQIGFPSEEADVIPASVARYIITHSQTYRAYMKTCKERPQTQPECLAYLQGLYMVLDFYATFVETVQMAKRVNALYVTPFTTKVKSDLRKTKAEAPQPELLCRIEQALRLFEHTVPVEVASYIGYDNYQIPGDTLATYHNLDEYTQLAELRQQAKALFCQHGYIQTGRNTFAPKGVYPGAKAFRQAFFTRLQELYPLLEFYAVFLDAIPSAKPEQSASITTGAVEIVPNLLDTTPALQPGTEEEAQMLTLLVDIERALHLFGHVMPVQVAKYTDYDSYQISGDTLAARNMAPEMLGLLDLKQQAETLMTERGER